MRASRAALDATVASLDEAQLLERVLDGGRSVKDELAHIAMWERLMSDAIVTTLTGGIPGWPEPGATLADVDRINEREYLASRDVPLADVLRGAELAYGRALALVESLTESQLNDAGAFGWTAERNFALAGIVRANTDQHYDEHREQIGAWLAAKEHAP